MIPIPLPQHLLVDLARRGQRHLGDHHRIGHPPFDDARLQELLFRYRARNWPDTLDADEDRRWNEFRRHRLDTHTPLTTLTREEYRATIANLRAGPALPAAQVPLLDALESWALALPE